MTAQPSIIGVDFSGARSDSSTVIASGCLQDDGLHIAECHNIARADLLQLLQHAPPGSIAALDFPFSVPAEFAGVLADSPRDMADVWQGVASMSMQSFIALRDEFVRGHGEQRRECDKGHPEAYSVLHKTNPNMLPMTLRGMQLLGRLRRPGIAVLSLDSPCYQGLTVLEVMPGASLRGMGLPYKGYKNGLRRDELRRRILAGLASAAPIAVANLHDISDQCHSSHDCLDAVVAALTAATFATHPGLVSTPPEGAIYRLEGWIYTTQPTIATLKASPPAHARRSGTRLPRQPRPS